MPGRIGLFVAVLIMSPVLFALAVSEFFCRVMEWIHERGRE